MLTLWDLLKPVREILRPAAPAPRAPAPKAPGPAKRRPAARGKAQATYDAIVDELLTAHNIKVRKWRQSMSGVAWVTTYRDGRTTRCLESPRPKSPMSLAIFLHEVGHHVIGLGAYKPRCLEEYHAWMFAIREMERRGIAVTPRVQTRLQRSLHYAVAKAMRRGLRALPAELAPYAERP